ncbi:M1 family aminopeptidase [Oscillospiraceae bacterium PP1C4]
MTRRLDVSLVAVLAALVFSLGDWCRQSFLTQWCVPLVPTLSDAFGSAIVWRTALYSRMVWLCLLGGAWLLSLLCVRQYEEGLCSSFFRHARKIVLPLLAVLLLCGGGLLWRNQPFVDHSPTNWMELMDAEADRSNENLTLARTELDVAIESYRLGTMSGTGTYTIHNSSGQPQELYFELNSGYKIKSVTANGEDIPFEDLHNDLIASREIHCTLPAAEEITLQIRYGGMARMWNESGDHLDADVISRESVTMTSKTLAPVVSRCVLVPDTSTVSLRIALNSSLTPVGTGTPTKLTDNGDGTTSWLVEDTATDRLFLYAGDYTRVELDAGDGNSIPFYYSQKYRLRLENGALDLMEQAIQYCTAHYGPKADASNAFKIVQTTAFNFGGFAVDNISGMGESYFSDDNLNDPDKGPASAEILAHEIVHQWWGLGATLMDVEDSAWSDEGITVYTTYRLMRQIKGEDYAQKNYVEKWESTMENLAASFYRRHPEYIDRLPERYQNDILSNESGANWYDGNALMIYRAAQMIGEERMDEVWAQLFSQGGTEMPPFISLNDFLTACGLEKGAVGRE